MWIPKREWEDLKQRISGIENCTKENANEKKHEPISLYKDNEMVHQVLRISLTDLDLCRLQNQPFYSVLMKFLHSL